ncbi:MAG: LPS export ABC transporter periplasmic protein LptC [Sphingomonas sp.]|nr:LPS export ABC transporter periplasmic protein LptC [Sphingomonas sp.]
MSDRANRIRSVRQRWAAPDSRHDVVVGVSRFILPVLIGVLSAFLVFMPLQGSGDVSFLLDKNKVEVASERLRIQSAMYRGADQLGRSFSISADSAVQKSSAEPVVQLSGLAARIALADGPATLAADRGRYDMKREQVAVDSAVQLRAADGYGLTTSSAVIDFKSRRLFSNQPVRGTLPQGSFRADRMTADLDRRIVRLDGNTHLRITPRSLK